MSLVEGIIKISFGASYNVDEGIRVIQREIRRSRRVIFNNIPVALVEEFLPLLKGKKVSAVLKENAHVDSVEEDIEDISYHTANIQAGYANKKMNFGCIVLPNIIFDITWDDKDDIRDITGLKFNKCLKCDYRLNLCEYAEKCDRDIYIGKILSPESGAKHLLNDLMKAEKAIIVYLPDFFLEKMIPFFNGKDIRILLPYGHHVHPLVKNMPQSRRAISWITPNLKIYDQDNAIAGGVCFPHIHYGVAWKDNNILEIRTIEMKECVRCMVEMYLTAWSFGKRLRF
jgi:hypothetical protein